jgi:transcriptional regulator with XRE-family HTH domain
MTFADRLKRLRGQTGLSQKNFAEQAGIAQMVMNRLEKGNRQPDAETLVALRNRFGADLNELLTGEERVSGGEGVPLYSSDDLCLPEGERIAKRWILHPNLPEGCFAWRISDSSMFPLLSCGDTVIVSSNAVVTGDLFLCRDETTKFTVRRLCCRDETTKIAVPENGDYRSSLASDLQVMGRVEAFLKVTLFEV